MVFAFAVWLIALTAAAGYGRLVMPSHADESGESEITRVYAGLLIVAAILLAAALFTNLTLLAGLVAALPGMVIYWRDRGSDKQPRCYIAILPLIALFVSLREIDLYDTALYHQQAVKWLAEHGLVRGVALVNFRFGFVSSWFALAAPLNHGIMAGRVGIIGGLPFALAVILGCQIVRTLLIAMRPRLGRFGLLLAAVAAAWHVDTSLSPDIMVWLLPLVVVTVIADRSASEADRLGRAVLISAMACLMKSTVAPIFAYCAALLAWRFIRVPEDRRRLAAFAAPALGALVLLIGANFVASGCRSFLRRLDAQPWTGPSELTRRVSFKARLSNSPARPGITRYTH